MKLLVALTTALACISSVASLQPQSAIDRRMALASFGSTILATTAISLPAQAAAEGGSVFCGTYSDPINHPGGKRTIRLTGEKLGDYQLAEVAGGGGIGEPKNYILPAVVVGDRAIIIDFSPKGGPRDFTGVIEKDGIKFLRDGNKWPRLE